MPGNGDSFDPSFSLRTSQVLTFTSNATNLDRRDRTPSSDVYVKAMRRVVRFYGVREVNRRYSGSCGENAWNAIEPTKKLIAVLLFVKGSLFLLKSYVKRSMF